MCRSPRPLPCGGGWGDLPSFASAQSGRRPENVGDGVERSRHDAEVAIGAAGLPRDEARRDELLEVVAHRPLGKAQRRLNLTEADGASVCVLKKVEDAQTVAVRQ